MSDKEMTMDLNCTISKLRARLSLRLGALVIAVLAMSASVGISAAIAAHGPFEVVDFSGAVLNENGTTASNAGSHPYAVINKTHFTSEGFDAVGGQEKDIIVDLPPGLIGNPQAVTSECTLRELFPVSREGEENLPADCPLTSQVGTVKIGFAFPEGPNNVLVPGAIPLFNMKPNRGQPALFAFNVGGFLAAFLMPSVRSESDYGITITSPEIIEQAVLVPVAQDIEFWGIPAAASHDDERCMAFGYIDFEQSCPIDVPELPYLTLPTDCATTDSKWRLQANTWQDPTDVEVAFFDHDFNGNPVGVEGCDNVPFTPKIEAAPRTKDAESPTGFDFELNIPDDGLLSPGGIAQAHVKKATVTLPEGVTINPSSAEGLSGCTPAQYAREQVDTLPNQGCPNASKVGSLSIETPLLEDPIPGSLYVARQDDPTTAQPGAENPFDSLLALYMVGRLPDRGIVVKAAGRIEPDPRTGQLVTTFDNLPRQPFSKFELHFREGTRAPLTTPPACGVYEVEADFVPWSASDPDNPEPSEIAHTTSSFEVTRGPSAGPCPSGGVLPFKPGFSAGSINNNAGSFTPFNMRLIRSDGQQDMTKFSATLPPGVLGKLAGVSKCPEAAIAIAKAKRGREEIANPSCPASSQIGHLLAGAGVGLVLTYVPGKIYLGGPYNGAPLSIIAITPGVAGPFDIGTVVVRQALTLNPTTAEVEVDGSRSDPIPHILEGIPLKVRDLRVYVDRENFILNPTSCDPSSVKATLFGSHLDLFSPADDVPVSLSDRFQAANCANLGFKPRLWIKLTGGTKRGAFPGLRAVLRARPGDANIGRASVALPASAFLAQEHLSNICTRVQFAKDACPKASIYGFAKAFTPLLDEPVQGPVYLRSSSNKLPDLVVDLHGLVDVEIASRIDSVKLRGAEAAGIRSTFASVPDAPVSKFVLRMQGGKKGLIVNSTNLCRSTNRAVARFVGQNGKPHNFRPVVKAQCGGKGRKGKRR